MRKKIILEYVTITQDTNHKRIDRPLNVEWDGAVGFFDGASHESGT
jgi:hypothetical protein